MKHKRKGKKARPQHLNDEIAENENSAIATAKEEAISQAASCSKNSTDSSSSVAKKPVQMAKPGVFLSKLFELLEAEKVDEVIRLVPEHEELKHINRNIGDIVRKLIDWSVSKDLDDRRRFSTRLILKSIINFIDRPLLILALLSLISKQSHLRTHGVQPYSTDRVSILLSCLALTLRQPTALHANSKFYRQSQTVICELVRRVTRHHSPTVPTSSVPMNSSDISEDSRKEIITVFISAVDFIEEAYMPDVAEHKIARYNIISASIKLLSEPGFSIKCPNDFHKDVYGKSIKKMMQMLMMSSDDFSFMCSGMKCLGLCSLLDDTQRPLPEVTIEEALEHLPQTPNRIVPSGFLQMYMNGIWYFWYLIRLQTVIEPASLSARISSFTGEAIISQLGFFCRYGYCDNIRNYWTRWKSLRLISDVVLKAGIRSLTFKGFSPTLTIYPLVDYMCRIAFDDLNIYNILKAKKGYSVEDLDCLAASRIRDLFEALNDENFYLGLSSCLAQIRRPDAVKLFVECYKERFSENWKLGCNPRWNNAAKGSVQTVKESDVHRSYKEGLVKIFIRSLCRIKISGNYPNMNSNQVDFDILNQNVRLLAYFEFFTFLVQVNLKCTYPSRIVDNDMLELIDAEFIQEFDAVMDVSKALTHDMLVRVEKNEEPARDSATAEQIVVLKMPRESQLEFLKACLLKLDELSNASREYKENVIKIAPNKCPVVSKYRKFLQLQGKLKDAEAKAKEGK